MLERVREAGGSAELDAFEPRPDVDELVAGVGQALSAADPEDALSAWDRAGLRHDPEVLDAALSRLTGGLVSRLLGRRRRLVEGARFALVHSTSVGTVQLALALLGEAGGRRDAAVMQELGVHPRLTLHAATALGNLRDTAGVEALLRLLHVTDGEARVVVVDRLLAHTRLPAVRVALLRDALVGLDTELARELAPYVAEACAAEAVAADESRPEELRAGARNVLSLVAE